MRKWRDRIYTPTQLSKVDNNYFIVDCWHNRIIYSDDLMDKICNWHTLSNRVLGGHTVSSDGKVIIVDSTDTDEILVFKKTKNKYRKIQTIKIQKYLPENFSFRNDFNLCRPHFTLFYKDNIFVVSLSWANALMVLENVENHIFVKEIFFPKIDNNCYLKFISVFDGLIWIAAREYLVGLDCINGKLIEKNRIEMPENFRDGINYITKIKNTYYLTAWGKGAIFCFHDFRDLYTNLPSCNNIFNFMGTPYFISSFEDRFFITEIDGAQGVYEFFVNQEGETTFVQPIFQFGNPIKQDLLRKRKNRLLR